MTNLQDKTITCRDCGREFLFTAGEQQFFAQRGYTNDPVRCPECRAARRAGSTDARGLGGYGARQMYPAVCARCGKSTQVPFEPRSDRPVYCSGCYSSNRSTHSSLNHRSESGHSHRYSDENDREMDEHPRHRSGAGRGRNHW